MIQKTGFLKNDLASSRTYFHIDQSRSFRWSDVDSEFVACGQFQSFLILFSMFNYHIYLQESYFFVKATFLIQV